MAEIYSTLVGDIMQQMISSVYTKASRKNKTALFLPHGRGQLSVPKRGRIYL